MPNIRTPPKVLTIEEQNEICRLYLEGEKTTELAYRYGVGERTIQRVFKGEYRKRTIVRKVRPVVEQTVKVKMTARKEALPPSKLSDFVPKLSKHLFNPEHLRNGATLHFRSDGTLVRVEGCPLYDGRNVAWRTGTVDVTEITGRFISGVTKQWSGEDIYGFLVFDGHEGARTINNCGFFYDRLPAKVEKEAEQVRDSLAAATGMMKLVPTAKQAKRVKDETAAKLREALGKPAPRYASRTERLMADGKKR